MRTRTPLSAWYALGALTITTLYAVIDRQVLALLAQPLKVDLLLSDTQIGSVQGLGSALFATIAVLPLGWLADRMDRRLLLALCILVWSTAIAACSMAFGYWSLLLCVAFLAAGEAGLSPIVYSIIPDLFSEKRRITANFIFFSATVLGAGVGLALSGAVIDHIEVIGQWLPVQLFTDAPWRLTFLVVALPGPLLALAILMIRLKPRPPRPQLQPELDSKGQLAAAPKSEVISYLSKNWKGVFGVYAGFGLALLGAGAFFTWMPMTLMRKFGATAGEVGTGFGAAVGIGSVAGLLIAALSIKLMKPKWGDAAPIRLPQIGFFICMLLAPLYLFARSSTEMFIIAGFQMTANIASTSLTPTVLQNLAPGHLRGRIFSISTVVTTLLQTISPITVGLLSDHIFTQPDGLLLSSVVFGIPCLLLATVVLRLSEKHTLRIVAEVRALSDPAPAPEPASPPAAGPAPVPG